MSTPSPSPQDKQQAHLAKTKRAILQRIADQGGSASMNDLHSFSEASFFIAHQRFSILMEDCVAEELVEFDAGDFHLTEQGRTFLVSSGV